MEDFDYITKSFLNCLWPLKNGLTFFLSALLIHLFIFAFYPGAFTPQYLPSARLATLFCNRSNSPLPCLHLWTGAVPLALAVAVY